MPKTVIVLGAGASKEVGLPTGIDLKKAIGQRLNIRFDTTGRMTSGDPHIFNALRQHVEKEAGRNVNPYLNAARRIRAAMPQAISIDNFIDAHRGDGRIELSAKLAIVSTILAAERDSALYRDHQSANTGLDYWKLEPTWFNAFLQLLTEDCRAADLDARLSSLTFIVFNYDRCVEQYLHEALQTYYGIGSDEAAAFVKRIHIYHPYGVVGALPLYGGANVIEFGGEVQGFQLLKLAGQIKTFAEGTDPTLSDVVAIRQKLSEADRFMFLGFAFHRLNLSLMWPERAETPTKGMCFATALGISASDVELITKDIANLSGMYMNPSQIFLRHLSCAELFREYWRSLSLR